MKFFQKVKTIQSKSGDVHFERWAIFETSWLSLYIHKIHKEDKDLHLHSHPWNFISIILRGSYLEETPGKLNVKKFLTISKMRKGNFHKIRSIISGPVYSLFLTYGKKEPWYYLVGVNKIESEEYRRIKNTRGFVFAGPLPPF